VFSPRVPAKDPVYSEAQTAAVVVALPVPPVARVGEYVGTVLKFAGSNGFEATEKFSVNTGVKIYDDI
jgi:hypothetical protein